eukprot:CFRG4299T1
MASRVLKLIPSLTRHTHKGQVGGRIAVIGGCAEYTGAPYYSAISSLKCGGDIAHVFCTSEASPVIKSYSPELIVHPYLKELGSKSCSPGDAFEEQKKTIVESVGEWLSRMDVLVVGPGLGRNPFLHSCVAEILQAAVRNSIPIIVDADGLQNVLEYPDVLRNYKKATLTPNVNEFKRLANKFLQSNVDVTTEITAEDVANLSGALGNVTVVCKGAVDMISDGISDTRCDEKGSLRRCGGQGDVLSGLIAVFTNWAHKARLESPSLIESSQVEGAYAGCFLTRYCSRATFVSVGRSMGVPDMITALPRVCRDVFPSKYALEVDIE